jgi:tRNA-intron endonuclease
MRPEGHLRGDAVRVGGDARQRFHDSRGYGRSLDGNRIALSRVEAAHLLVRGDLDAVRVDGEPLGFAAFVARAAAATDRFARRFLVYADMRERGFYLSPVRDGWPGGAATADADHGSESGPDSGSAPAPVPEPHFVAFERGTDPAAGRVAHRIRVVGEREAVPAAGLAGTVLAVVDDESDLTYFEATRPSLSGATDYEPPRLRGTLLDDRLIAWDAPPTAYERGFYGRPLAGRGGTVAGDSGGGNGSGNENGSGSGGGGGTADPGRRALQLSLVEAAALAGRGRLSLTDAPAGDADDVGDAGNADGSPDAGGPDAARAAIRERGRVAEGDRFDRRLRAYEALRADGLVPKTGFKFGADFRTYRQIESVAELPHSERLVRVVEPDHAFDPRALSLDVRLAGGVRKRMVFALTPDPDPAPDAGIDWLSVARLTP